MSDDATVTTVRVFRQRREYTRVLLEMSLQQESLITRDAYTELLELLANKQQILMELEKLSAQNSQLWHNWKTVRENLADDVRLECESLLEATESDMAELVDCEHRGTEELHTRRDALQAKLSTISNGSVAHHAYHVDDSPTHRIDIGQ